MSLSLGELEALCRKAARGAGFDWGPAEEAGRAVRRLATLGLPGAELLLVRLDACDGARARDLSPRSLDGEWRSGGTVLCPILAGASLADVAERLGDTGEIVLHDVLAPLLLVPFAGLAARRLNRAVSVAWTDVLMIDDGDALRLDGEHERVTDARAGTIRCRVLANGDALAGEPLPRITRARPDPACIERLDAFARRTYAPATEESRMRGAGGMSADDG